MQASEPACFIGVTPTGALTWLGQADRSPERDVIERLLSLDGRCPVNLRAMCASMSWSLAELGRVLFVLNRSRGVQIDAVRSPDADPGGNELARLDDNLRALVGTGQCALLAGSDGLCLAACGWSVEEADVTAGGLAASSAARVAAQGVTLFFARERVVFFSDAGVDLAHPSWIPVVRRLMRACGPLGLDLEAA